MIIENPVEFRGKLVKKFNKIIKRKKISMLHWKKQYIIGVFDMLRRK